MQTPSMQTLSPTLLLALLTGSAAAGGGSAPHPYRAQFEADSVRFVLEHPQAPQALTLRLVSVGREGGPGERPAVTERSRDARKALYRRGTLTERYDLLPHGLEQSFVFDVLPPGEGDLVVRVGVESALPLAHADGDSVVLGDVRIAEVVGIDADGRRAPGAIAWRDGELELRLPAAFVEAAALPLVLDPLIGDAHIVAPVLLSAPGATERQIDVAYLPGADRYLTAWRGDTQDECGSYTSGRLLAPNGVAVGPIFSFLDPGLSFPCFATDPAVASSVGAQRFVVVEAGGSTLASGYFSLVDPVTMQATPPAIVSPGFVESIDVGGEATGASTTVVVVTMETGAGVIMRRLDAADGTVLATQTLTTDTSDRRVAISSSGGLAGRYLVTWSRGPFGAKSIWGAVVANDLTVLAPPFPITAGTEAENDSAVDGDGDHWIVAFERTGLSGDNDVVCAGVTWDALAATARLDGERVVEGDAGQEERDPSVAWAGESVLISFTEQFSGPDYDVYVRSVEAFDCLACEGEVLVSDPPTGDETIRVASERAAGGAGNGGMLVWLAGTDTASPNVMAHPWLSEDGAVQDLGGGCGTGGVADATCARVGAQDFGLRLEGATPSALAGVLLGLNRLDLVCGPCTLVVDPTDAIVMPTDADGHAEVSLALPAPVSFTGAVFHAQWLVAGPSGCGSFSFSNALEITVD